MPGKNLLAKFENVTVPLTIIKIIKDINASPFMATVGTSNQNQNKFPFAFVIFFFSHVKTLPKAISETKANFRKHVCRVEEDDKI